MVKESKSTNTLIKAMIDKTVRALLNAALFSRYRVCTVGQDVGMIYGDMFPNDISSFVHGWV
jgi:hypothetical protein